MAVHSRWRQFSLRTLLGMCLLASLAAAWLSWEVRAAMAQRKAVEALRGAGVVVTYGEPRALWARSAWVREQLGDEATRDVVELTATHVDMNDECLAQLQALPRLERLKLIFSPLPSAGLRHLRTNGRLKLLWLMGQSVTDDDLQCLDDLPDLEDLWLIDTQITDEGLEHVSRRSRLKMLALGNTAVTDHGLAKLSVLRQLEWIALDNTRVTPQGVESLRQALPELRINH